MFKGIGMERRSWEIIISLIGFVMGQGWLEGGALFSDSKYT
jgi:hypothetical protein